MNYFLTHSKLIKGLSSDSRFSISNDLLQYVTSEYRLSIYQSHVAITTSTMRVVIVDNTIKVSINPETENINDNVSSHPDIISHLTNGDITAGVHLTEPFPLHSDTLIPGANLIINLGTISYADNTNIEQLMLTNNQWMGTVTANEDFEYLIFPFTSRSVAENSRFAGRWEFKYLIPSTTIKVAMTFDNTNARLAVYNREDNAFPELDIIASLTEIRTTVNKRLYFLSINSFHRIHKIMSLSEIPILVEQWYRSTIGYRPWW